MFRSHEQIPVPLFELIYHEYFNLIEHIHRVWGALFRLLNCFEQRLTTEAQTANKIRSTAAIVLLCTTDVLRAFICQSRSSRTRVHVSTRIIVMYVQIMLRWYARNITIIFAQMIQILAPLVRSGQNIAFHQMIDLALQAIARRRVAIIHLLHDALKANHVDQKFYLRIPPFKFRVQIRRQIRICSKQAAFGKVGTERFSHVGVFTVTSFRKR
mmetsp:Transcript_3693/g.5701  ORF Transcript_3693/g.5701 Transcript_3693/m.5701 type:complete len:213 (+) Transcript_3693:1601-2239(+)